MTTPPGGVRPRASGRATWAAALAICVLAAAMGLGQMRHYGVTIDSPSLFYSGDRTLFWILSPHVPGALDFLGREPPGFKTAFERHPEERDPLHYPVLTGLAPPPPAGSFTIVWASSTWWTDTTWPWSCSTRWPCSSTRLYSSRLLGPVAGISATVDPGPVPLGARPLVQQRQGLAVRPVLRARRPRRRRRHRRGPRAPPAGLGRLRGSGPEREAQRRLRPPHGPPVDADRVPSPLSPPSPRLGPPRGGLPSGPVRRGARLLRPLAVALLRPAAGLVAPHPLVRGLHGRLRRGGPLDLDRARARVPGLHDAAARALPSPSATCSPGGREDGSASPSTRSCSCGSCSPRPHLRPALALLRRQPPLHRVRAGAQRDGRWGARPRPRLAARAPSRASGRWALAVGAALGLVGLLWPVLEYHPYETAYFNAFAGGLGRAQRQGLFLTTPFEDRLNGTEGDYWYSSLRAGLRNLEALSPGARTVGPVRPALPAGTGRPARGQPSALPRRGRGHRGGRPRLRRSPAPRVRLERRAGPRGRAAAPAARRARRWPHLRGLRPPGWPHARDRLRPDRLRPRSRAGAGRARPRACALRRSLKDPGAQGVGGPTPMPCSRRESRARQSAMSRPMSSSPSGR